jgi:ubiquinone/menaquinone biosynthesis C-methylase UbiE
MKEKKSISDIEDPENLHVFARQLSPEEWYKHLAKCLDGEADNRRCPKMPTDDVQRRTNSIAGKATLEGAWHHYRLFGELMLSNQLEIKSEHRILDYGCGWGRVLRFFLRDVPESNLAGVDVQEILVDAAREAFPHAALSSFVPNQPIPFADNYFDLAYSISILSHLSEEFHLNCIRDLLRVVKVGGIIINTFLGPAQVKAQIAKPRESSHLWRQFGDLNAVIERMQLGYFIHTAPSNHKLPGYGTSAIGHQWIRDHWPKELDILCIADGTPYTQSVILARRSR